ncbi:peroxiredoxin-like family protein [Croceimicrobium sp.]|uniref:peroxiredoxin-like family protein n=1 Tax=Croceimicrobium sp. TaxID=2828340 RepID=UPI003BAD3B31
MLRYLFSALFSLVLFSACSQDLDSVQGLPVGAKAPLPSLQNEEGQKISLSQALEKGPIVLIFYRGQWCPYCNRHLSALEAVRDSLEAEGAQLFAISPEKPEYLQEMQAKTEAGFTLLYDSAYQTILAYDLAFLPSAGTRFKYNTLLGADLSEAHGDERELLPVPASFLIDQKGIIRWRHFDPDYTQRSEPSEILKALKAL